MGATRARLIRARNIGGALYEEQGIKAVITYFSRYFVNKVPLMVLHFRQRQKVGLVASQVTEARAADGVPQLSIKVSGGIGDFLVIARFLRDMRAATEDFTFDVYASSPAAAAWVFREVPGFRSCYADILFDRMLPHYDVGLYVCQFVIVYDHVARWGALRAFPKLVHVCSTIIKYRRKIDIYVEKHPWMDNGLARKAVFTGLSRADYLHFIAGIPFGGKRLDLPHGDPGLLAKHGLIEGGYITIHNGFDTGFIISGRRATKCYPHFNDVIAKVKKDYPDIPVVQVGTSTSDAIPEVDLNLIGLTTMTEVAELIRHSRLHVDNESGLVHMAVCLGVKCCVVFGPTPVDYFGYEGNLNVGPPVCGGCWWIDDTWMDRCPRGHATPICMTTQEPQNIAALISKELEDMHANQAVLG